MGSRSPHEKGQFWGKGSPIVKYRHFLPWAVQKRLNWSICCLGCGLGCAERSTSSIVFARWRQCALPCGHIGATWQIRLNHPSVAAMRSCVKLLWPLVIIKMCVRSSHDTVVYTMYQITRFDILLALWMYSDYLPTCAVEIFLLTNCEVLPVIFTHYCNDLWW